MHCSTSQLNLKFSAQQQQQWDAGPLALMLCLEWVNMTMNSTAGEGKQQPASQTQR
jgi:hypothetical protein